MGRGEDRGLDLFDPATQTFTAIPLSAGKKPGWGEDTCTESIGRQIQPHGLSLSKRTSGEWQLYVVNHNARESIESRILYDNNGKALINRVSVAIEAGDAFYVGSFQGNLLLKLPR
jgi:hypothetical protein